jgi:DNA-binding transcriptional LysR family regulator
MSHFKSTLEQWRVLREVIETGGYLQAAEKLHRSHSSLNHAVSKLQQQLGIQLVEVKGRKTKLTQVGEQMMRRASLILDEVHALEAYAQTIEAGWESEITIAVELTFPRSLLASILQEFAVQSRGVWLNIVDVFLGSTSAYIQEAKADLVITEILPEGFVGDPIYKLDMLPVAHPSHPIFKELSPPVRLRELVKYLQITTLSNEATQLYKTGWQKSQQRWVVDNFDAVVSLLRKQVGFGWITSDMAKPYIENSELKEIELEEGPGYKGFLFLVAPRIDELGPAGKLLAQIIKTHSVLEQKTINVQSKSAHTGQHNN